MKNHLKRIAAPPSWILARRQHTFVVRPDAGGHPLQFGLPLGIIMRDVLKVAATMTEACKLLQLNEVLVDGIRQKNHRFMVGLFDVLTLPSRNSSYRLLLDNKGRLALIAIPVVENTRKICKVIGKKKLKSGKTQLNLHDGRNILSEEKVQVGDSVVLSLPQQQLREVLALQSGAAIFLVKGKHAGDIGKLKKIEGKEAIYSSNGADVETAKDYLFVVGAREASITLKENK